MKQPLMFDRLLRDWMSMPEILDQAIARGDAGLSAEPGWVPIKGLSAISDAFPPQAYAYPGAAQVYNKAIRKFRRRAAFSAFMAGISLSELEARLETYSQLYSALMGRCDEPVS